MNIKVLLVDDHDIVREGLRELINRQPDMAVVGEAGDGRSAIELAGSLVPDVVVMDVSMPDLNGVDAARQICSGEAAPKVLCLSMHAEHRYVEAMLRAGAAGYLVKSCASRELAEAIRAVQSGKSYLSPEIADLVVDRFVRSGGSPPSGTAFSELTRREREILQLLAEGRSVKDVASKLFVSINTVHTHRRHIMAKLSLSSTADIVRYAIREGLVSP